MANLASVFDTRSTRSPLGTPAYIGYQVEYSNSELFSLHIIAFIECEVPDARGVFSNESSRHSRHKVSCVDEDSTTRLHLRGELVLATVSLSLSDLFILYFGSRTERVPLIPRAALRR
jgi:hypothetical protein